MLIDYGNFKNLQWLLLMVQKISNSYRFFGLELPPLVFQKMQILVSSQ